jgi:glycosyltransferase involved in cell wall biosynthesis
MQSVIAAPDSGSSGNATTARVEQEGEPLARATAEYCVGVSVVVCCYNSASRIAATLAALATQQLSVRWEVVLVDNNSTDDTVALARRAWARKDVPLQVVREARQGLSWARIRGLSVARGKWLCFVDDDNCLMRGYLNVADEIFAAYPEVGLVGGEGHPAFERTPPGWLDQRYWRSLALGPQGPAEGIVAGPLYGAGMCVRKEVWCGLQAAGWEPTLRGRSGSVLLSGEDSELCLVASCLGWKAYFSPRMRFQHLIPDARLTWAYWLRLYDGFGRSGAVFNVLKGVLERRHSPARQLMHLVMRTCYALGHVPLMPIFWCARRFLPVGSPIAMKGSFRYGFARYGLVGIRVVGRLEWWRALR